MSVSSVDFLRTAENLLKLTSEIDHRNSASRAYYSVFHHCGPLANDLGTATTSKSGMHNSFIDQFTTSTNLKAKSIGYLLRQCHDLRIVADYHIDSEFSHSDAETAVKLAKRIIDAADKLK
ncbi:MAG: HEPN domain-containing protein [Sulfuricaulis sp.]